MQGNLGGKGGERLRVETDKTEEEGGRPRSPGQALGPSHCPGFTCTQVDVAPFTVFGFSPRLPYWYMHPEMASTRLRCSL